MGDLVVTKQARIQGARPELTLALLALSQAARNSPNDIAITSIVDGIHSRKSLHYVGLAIDADAIGDISREEIDRITIDLTKGLTVEFDVVDEWKGDAFSHWHIEFQPKTEHQAR